MQQIGRYLVIRELGRGAMGVVFEAHDPLIGRTVAVKTIRLDTFGNPLEADLQQERLFREARSAGALSHPGIVVIHDLGRHEQTAYIAMERVDGPTLEQFLAANGTPAPPETLNILRQAAAALDHAHENGVVHRDIKPANLMLHKGAMWKITDFGIAKIIATQQLTQTGMVLGTPSYMSPEHISAQPVDGRTDQFSLAVMAFELLVGRKPFQADSLPGLVHQIVYAERISARSLRPDLPDALDAVLKRGLAKDAADRYESCLAFVDALENCVLPQSIPAQTRQSAAEQKSPRATAENFCRACGGTLVEGQDECHVCARPLGPDTGFEKAYGIARQQPLVESVDVPLKLAPLPTFASAARNLAANPQQPLPEPPSTVLEYAPATTTTDQPSTKIKVRGRPMALIGVAVVILAITAIVMWSIFHGRRSTNLVAEQSAPTAGSREQEPIALKARAVEVPARSKAKAPQSAAPRTEVASSHKLRSKPMVVESPQSPDKPPTAQPFSGQPAPGETYLQLRAISKAEADVMVDILHQKNFKAIASQIPEKPDVYRVLVGPLADGTLNQTKSDLTSSGFPGDKAIKKVY